MAFDQNAYDDFLVENGVVGVLEEPITLRSGGLSFWYANFRALLRTTDLSSEAAEYVHRFAKDQEFDFTNVFAVPEGPRRFASYVDDLLREHGATVVPAASLRSGYKTHGSPVDRYTVGPVEPWLRPLLLEDVSTTGNSSSEYVMLMQELGIPPVVLVSMLSRQEKRKDGKTVSEFIEGNFGVPYRCMTVAESVIPKVIAAKRPPEHVLEGLRYEFSDSSRYTAELRI